MVESSQDTGGLSGKEESCVLNLRRTRARFYHYLSNISDVRLYPVIVDVGFGLFIGGTDVRRR